MPAVTTRMRIPVIGETIRVTSARNPVRYSAWHILVW